MMILLIFERSCAAFFFRFLSLFRSGHQSVMPAYIPHDLIEELSVWIGAAHGYKHSPHTHFDKCSDLE
jgi:hypothetical protein